MAVVSGYDLGALAFGTASTLLYIGWGYFMSGTQERYMTWTLWCYASANIGLLWPQLKRAWTYLTWLTGT